MRESPRADGNLIRRAAVSGSVAGIAVALGLGLLAQREGKRPFQPINATSHWLHGDRAAHVRRADLAHTLIGYVTHHASAIFWAVLFEWLLGRRHRTPGRIAAASVTTAAVAGAVDYGMVPKRLTPGWEEAVSPRAVAASFLVMALGLAIGASLRGRTEHRAERGARR